MMGFAAAIVFGPGVLQDPSWISKEHVAPMFPLDGVHTVRFERVR